MEARGALVRALGENLAALGRLFLFSLWGGQIEAAGAPVAVTTAVRAAGRGGAVVLLGLPPAGKTSEFPADMAVYNDLTVRRGRGRGRLA
jgi:hypothetical protein